MDIAHESGMTVAGAHISPSVPTAQGTLGWSPFARTAEPLRLLQRMACAEQLPLKTAG